MEQLTLEPREDHAWIPDPESPAFCRLCDRPRSAHPNEPATRTEQQ